MSTVFEDYLTEENFKTMRANARLVKKEKKNIWDAYTYFKDFFKKKKPSVNNLILASSVSYSWMPTMLDIRTKKGIRSINKASEVLSVIRSINISADLNDTITIIKALTQLKEVINNSMVGASKVMHLFHDNAPIIDSRVRRSWNWFFSKKEFKIKEDVKGYLKYWEIILFWQEVIIRKKPEVTVRDIEKLFFDFARHPSVTPPRKKSKSKSVN